MKIRTAEKYDVAAISNLHAQSWRFAYRGALSDEYLAGDIVSDRASLWAQRLSAVDKNQYVIVAELDAQIIGFACAFGLADPVWGTLLDNIHVCQKHHRNGIGASLMQQIARWYLEFYSSSPMFLWVLQSNASAQQFYQALGAENVGADTWFPPGGGAVPRFRYAWQDISVLL